MADIDKQPPDRKELAELIVEQNNILAKLAFYFAPASEERRERRLAKACAKIGSYAILGGSAVLASWEFASYSYENWQISELASKYAKVSQDLYYNDNNIEVSKKFITKALDLDGENTNYLLFDAYIDGMASVRHLFNLDRPYTSKELNQAHEAIAKSALLREYTPESPQPYLLRGQIYAALKEYKDAKKMLQKAIELEPKNDFALMRLGVVSYLSGDFVAAVQNLESAQKINPNSKWTYLWRGIISLEQKKPIEEVVGWLNKALKIDPKFDLAYYNLAWANLKKRPKDYRASEKHFRRALALNPAYKEAFYGLGMVFGYQNEYQIAETYFSKAIELDETFLTAYKWRGIVRDEMKMFDLAMEDFSKAIDLDPSSGDTYVRRARVATKVPLYEKAMKDLALAKRFDPDNTRIDLYQSQIYLELNQMPAALKSIETALKKRPNYPEALSLRSKIFVKTGRLDDALSDLTAAIKLAKYRPERFYQLRGDIYLGMGVLDKAEHDFLFVSEKDIKNIYVVEKLIKIYIKINNKLAAQETLSKFISIEPNNSLIEGLNVLVNEM